MVHHGEGILALFHLKEKIVLYWLSIALFILTYLMIILEKYFHRVSAALFGASLTVFLGLITPQEAWNSIDFNTIFLLLGMMIMVAILIDSGFFFLLSALALKFTEGKPLKILIVFTTLTAFISAFLDNVTTVLFIVPILITVLRKLKINPIPYIVAVILASNIGGTATLIGDPPNIIIGSLGNFSFGDFLKNLTPIVIATYLVGIGVMIWQMREILFSKNISQENKVEEVINELLNSEFDYPLMRKALIIFFITIFLFFFHHLIGLPPGIVALTMASVLLLWSNLNPEKVFLKIEWSSLMFFLGLFIVIGALEHNGVFEKLSHWVASFLHSEKSGIWIIGIFSALISGIVDNIPFTMAMSHVLLELSKNVNFNTEPLWWALALGACLGGNLTLIGASANIVAAGLAQKEGYKISFWDFFKQAFLVSFTTVITALLLLYIWKSF